MDRTQDQVTGASATGSEYCPPRAGIYREGDSSEIKQGIDRTRAEMDQTIDQLGERLRPRRLLDQALGRWASAGDCAVGMMPDRSEAARIAGRAARSAGRTLGHQIKQHPIPAVLMGAGICYLLYEQFAPRSSSYSRGGSYGTYASSRPGRTIISECDVPDYYGSEPGMRERAGGAYESAKHRAAEAGRSMRDRIAGMGQTLRHKASDAAASMRQGMSCAGEGMRQRTSSMGDAASEQAGYVKEKMQYAAARAGEGMRSSYYYGRDKVSRTANEYPLSMGLASLAAGLVAGLSLPHTRTEDRWMGEQADRVKDYARDTGEELMERGKEVARATADAAADQARAEGLTPSQLKDRIKNVAKEAKEKVKHVAQGTKDAARDAAKDKTKTTQPTSQQATGPVCPPSSDSGKKM